MANINKIRVSGTTYDIQDSNAPKVIELTQAEFDALTVKDPNVFYVITDSEYNFDGYWTSAQTQNAITQSVSSKADTTAVTSVSDSLTAHTANTTVHVTAQDKTNWNNKSDFSGNYNDLTNKPTIPTVPTSNTAFTNDAGYITSSALNGYATTGDVQTALASKADTATTYTKTEVDTALASKQTTLTAGRGISITTGETADTISFSLPISAGTGTNSIAEGYNTTASGNYSHAEGYNTTASGHYSHTDGGTTTASGNYSHAEGQGTTAKNLTEHASGRYNNSASASTTFGNSGNTLFSVGNGTSSSARHNAFEIRQDGSIYIPDLSNGTSYRDRPMIKLQDHLGGGGSVTVDSALSPTSENPVQNKVIYSKIDEVEQVTAAGLNALNDKFGGLKLQQITQSAYDQLQTKDPSTLYVIVD